MGNTRIYEKLLQLQQAYSAPKDAYNSFGGYSYRNFESMLDGLKPLLSQYGLVLTTTNRLQECAGHVYVQSTCILTDTETGESISSDSFAREDDSRKGMAAPQITGSCVSYSAKYALGLLLSVGTGQRDADSMDNRPSQTQNSRPQTRPTPPPQPAPYQPPMQAAPMQYTAPPMQYTAPPMAPQQTAPQYQPPQQPVTAPPVQQAQPMAQQPPMQTPPQPQQAPSQTPTSADAPKPFTRKNRDFSADAQNTQPQQTPISADAQNANRPPVPQQGSVSTVKIAPQPVPASWGIAEAPSRDDLVPYDSTETAYMGGHPSETAGWMAVPDGIDEELPFN